MFKKICLIIAVSFNLIIIISPDLHAQETVQKNESCFYFLSYIPPVKKGPDEKIWSFNLAGLYSKYNGNSNTLYTNLASTLEMDNNISNFEVSFSVFYDEVDETATKNKGSGIIKYDHYVFPRIELFVFSQSEYNKMSLLDHRNSSGTGAKFVILRNNVLKFDISSAFVYETEKYETESYTRDYRISCRARIKFSPVKPLLINFVYFYIPKANYARHYRLSMDAFAKLEINKIVFLKTGYNNEYNKNALPGTKKTDDNYYLQLGLNF